MLKDDVFISWSHFNFVESSSEKCTHNDNAVMALENFARAVVCWQPGCVRGRNWA